MYGPKGLAEPEKPVVRLDEKAADTTSVAARGLPASFDRSAYASSDERIAL